MNANLDQDTTDADLRRYLLGDLPEAARDDLEARLLADENAFQATLAAEDDLVDDYARGALPDAERRAFEEHLLPRPGMARRLAFARSLATVTAEARAAQPARPDPAAAGRVTPSPWSERLSRWLGGLVPAPALQLAGAAAVLLLAVTAGWLAVQNAQLDRRVAQLEADRQELSATTTGLQQREAELARELAAARAAADDLATDPTDRPAELANARQRIAELEGELAEVRRQPSARKVSVSFMLALATRSAGVRNLAVPAAADTVELQLDATADAGYFDAFRVQVLGPGGTEVWSRTGLAADPQTGTVDLELPAEALVSGRYEILLEGLGAGGPELIGAYEFEIRRP